MEPPRTTVRVAVGEKPIDASALVTEVSRTEAGASVVFVGTVRDHSGDKTGITHLDYEVYHEKVEQVIAVIVDEVTVRWPILAVVVEHRSGRVDTGQASVAVAVSAAHRADAFEAARYLIDELKTRAPIWKKEHWPGGSEWSQGS